MYKYEVIEQQIKRARIERSVYLANLLTTAIAAAINGVRQAGTAYFSNARIRSHKGLFTFDA